MLFFKLINLFFMPLSYLLKKRKRKRKLQLSLVLDSCICLGTVVQKCLVSLCISFDLWVCHPLVSCPCTESWMSALPRDFILRLVSIYKNVVVQILNTAQHSNSEVRERERKKNSLISFFNVFFYITAGRLRAKIKEMKACWKKRAC